MPAPDLIQALATVAVGALSGGLTNAVAIWMLVEFRFTTQSR